MEELTRIDILDAMHLPISAWNVVSGMKIFYAFQHAGFIKEKDI